MTCQPAVFGVIGAGWFGGECAASTPTQFETRGTNRIDRSPVQDDDGDDGGDDDDDDDVKDCANAAALLGIEIGPGRKM